METIVEIDGLGDIIAYSVKTIFEQTVQELIQELQDSGVNITGLSTKTTQLPCGQHVLTVKTVAYCGL